MRILRRIILVLAILLAVAAAAFTAWGLTPAQPMPEALSALQSDSQVTVTSGAVLGFSPAGQTPTTAFIFYPGGHVDYRAYAPLARELAAQGFLVFIPRMPLNLAVLAPDAAGRIIAAHPEVTSWTVGGHSLGGAMAARFALQNPGIVQGLVLLAAYPASSDDLSKTSLRVLSISASLDGLATPEKIAASLALLPADASRLEIAGGNHAQFGWYGEQPGDLPARVSRSAQQAQVTEAIAAFLASARDYK